MTPSNKGIAISNHVLPLLCLPIEVEICVMTFLRAYDLSALQSCCHHFNSPELITSVINHTATRVYPEELTEGFEHIVGGNVSPRNADGYFMNYEPMRNMETLVMVRVLMRPEPPLHEHGNGFYVSKSWCKTALQWLESRKQQEPSPVKNNKGKKTKRKERIRSRRYSDASPPWSNVNHDLTCEHGDLRHCSSKQARARRRVMDKAAWKVLKKLYPDSVQLRALQTECVQCTLELETAKKSAEDQKEREKARRQKPLGCSLVRGFYTRGNKGVPYDSLITEKQMNNCPLKPGIYNILPRAWCHGWRKYIKNGGEIPYAPDGSALLCDAHKLPLVAPHLEMFLSGQSPHLLCAMTNNSNTKILRSNQISMTNSSISNFCTLEQIENEKLDFRRTLSAAGISQNRMDAELEAQQLELFDLQKQHSSGDDICQECGVASSPLSLSSPSMLPISNFPSSTTPPYLSGIENLRINDNQLSNNELLDQENKVVVEILTEEEYVALQQWWPEMHSSFVMKFAVTDDNIDGGLNNITWSTPPCRECDPGHCKSSVVVRNRNRERDRKPAHRKLRRL